MDEIKPLSAEQARICLEGEQRVSLQRILREHCKAIAEGRHAVYDTRKYRLVEVGSLSANFWSCRLVAIDGPQCAPTLTECPRCRNDVSKCDGIFASHADPLEPLRAYWSDPKNWLPLPEWAQWVACDEDGDWWVTDVRPQGESYGEHINKSWDRDAENIGAEPALNGADWREAIFERPKG